MQKLLVANWKMNPQRIDEVATLAGAYFENESVKDGVKLILAAPFIFLEHLGKLIMRVSKNNSALAAQDVFWEGSGAFTGEISPTMLKGLGVQYVIVGHSERRKWLGETDEMVRKKIRAALDHKLDVILCVGEPKEVRDKGFDAAKEYVKKQLDTALAGINQVSDMAIIIAYEPIWAIGTGAPDKPEDTASMALFIKKELKFITGAHHPVLYGGSVTSANAQSFFEYVEIDGALVGGASLKADEFNAVIDIAHRVCEAARAQGK